MGENAAGITAGIASANYSDEDIFLSAMIGLAGKAGVDVILGRFDTGVGDDLQKVHQLLSSWATRYAGNGFGSFETCDRPTSEQSMREHELLIAAKMDELYQKARTIVFENKDSICALSKVLIREYALLNSDIAKVIGC